jgi:GT2 family glycosyltransferase
MSSSIPSSSTLRVAISILHWPPGAKNETLRLMESLIKLPYPNFDIWLVDNTGEILPADVPKSVHLLEPGSNLGFSRGHNMVIEQVKDTYDYILLLNNDVEVRPDFLTKLVAALEEDSSAAAAGPTILYTEPTNKIWYAGGEIMLDGMTRHWRAGEKWTGVTETKPVPVTFVTGCSLLMRLKDVRRIGLLDDRYFLYFEDADWCARATLCGRKLLYVPEAIVHHGVSAGLSVNSPQYLYYNIRNRLMFAAKYLPPHRMVLAWASTLWQTGKEKIKLFTRYRRDYGTYLRLMVRAYFDFLRGKTGPL